MDSQAYAMLLEKRMVEQFKKSFYEKMGYTPVVLTRVYYKGSDEYMPMMTLESLEQHFEDFLPERYGEKLKLSAKCRLRPLVEVRNIFCYMARQMGYSLVTIGQYLGNRDHTTVIHNVATCRNLLETDENFQVKYARILKTIKSFYESSALDLFDQVQHQPEPAVLP